MFRSALLIGFTFLLVSCGFESNVDDVQPEGLNSISSMSFSGSPTSMSGSRMGTFRLKCNWRDNRGATGSYGKKSTCESKHSWTIVGTVQCQVNCSFTTSNRHSIEYEDGCEPKRPDHVREHVRDYCSLNETTGNQFFRKTNISCHGETEHPGVKRVCEEHFDKGDYNRRCEIMQTYRAQEVNGKPAKDFAYECK